MASQELQRAKDLLRYLVSIPDGSIETFRRLYEEVCANFHVPADAEVTDAGLKDVPSLWVRAPGAATNRAVVLLHGGGWCMGSAYGYREFAYRISQAADCGVLVVDYRLAPEEPYPAALDDAVAAYRWAVGQDGIDQVGFLGDSAGGGLALSALVKLRDDGDPMPSWSVLCSPLVDLAGEGRSLTERAHLDPLPASTLVSTMGQAYLAGHDPKSTPLASSLYADLRDLPPLLVLVGTDEGLHDDSVRLVDKIRNSGGHAELVVGDGMVHIWPIFNFLPEAADAIDRIGNFLRKGFAES